MPQREDAVPPQRSHESRALWSWIVALVAVLFGADAAAQQLIAPQFFSVPVTSVDENAVYNYSIVVIDLEPLDTVTITAPTLPAWLTFTDNGNRTATLTGVPTQAQVGAHSVVLQASDGVNTAQQSFTITVSNVNEAPTFTSTPSTTGSEGSPYSYTMTASDADGNSLTFAAPTLPAWLSFNGTNTISGTPLQAQVGPHNVVVTVSDGTAPAVQQSFTITVSNVNDAPAFTSTPSTTGSENSPYSYTMTASDARREPTDVRRTHAAGLALVQRHQHDLRHAAAGARWASQRRRDRLGRDGSGRPAELYDHRQQHSGSAHSRDADPRSERHARRSFRTRQRGRELLGPRRRSAHVLSKRFPCQLRVVHDVRRGDLRHPDQRCVASLAVQRHRHRHCDRRRREPTRSRSPSATSTTHRRPSPTRTPQQKIRRSTSQHRACSGTTRIPTQARR